jgi:hydrogenase-1 operon protein HyaE
VAHSLIEALGVIHGLPTVDGDSVDVVLRPAAGEPPHTLLFFAGDPDKRVEALDVAVVMPELLAAFRGRLRGAVVAPGAVETLRPRFHVIILPSLVVTRGVDVIGVLPRILDWADYTDRIAALLDPSAPVMTAPDRPQVAISHAGRRVDA